MGSVFRGPSPGSPTPREEGVVWSHVSLWTPGSLSRAKTPPQNPKTPQDPALLALETAEAWSSVGVLNWPVTHTRGEGGRLGGRSGGHGCREAGPGGNQELPVSPSAGESQAPRSE